MRRDYGEINSNGGIGSAQVVDDGKNRKGEDVKDEAGTDD